MGISYDEPNRIPRGPLLDNEVDTTGLTMASHFGNRYLLFLFSGAVHNYEKNLSTK